MKPTLAELEALLERKDVQVSVLPSGEIVVNDRIAELERETDRLESERNHARDMLAETLIRLDGVESDLAECRRIRWIPISERLPDEDLNVLVVTPSKMMWTACLHGDEWYPPGDEMSIEVDPTHWMPLPEAP